MKPLDRLPLAALCAVLALAPHVVQSQGIPAPPPPLTVSRANIEAGTPNRVLINDGTGALAESPTTDTEVGYLSGASLGDANRFIIGDASGKIVTRAAVTGNRALATDSSGLPLASTTTDVELSYVNGVTGPIQTQVDNAAYRGTVLMVRTSDSCLGCTSPVNATWRVILPDGSDLDTTGTTSQGLQEAIDYAAEFAYNLFVRGGGIAPEVFGVPYGGALGTDPFATTISSTTVTVTHASHPFSTGNYVKFTDLAGAVNGIPASEFGTKRELTVLDGNSYTIDLDTTASSTGSGGGSNVRYNQASKDAAVINCTAPITVPPIQNVRWDINATINFGGSPGGSPPAISFDSIMLSDIHFSGQVVAVSAYGSIFEFAPSGELPEDAFGPVITSTTFQAGSTVLAGSGHNIIFDASSAPIGDGNYWRFNEPNGGATGIRIVNGSSSGFYGNFVRAVDVHNVTTCVNAGIDNTDGPNQHDNIWFLDCDPDTLGVDLFSVDEEWHLSIGNDEGSPTTGVTLNNAAARHQLHFRRNDATTKINDAATQKSSVWYAPRSMVRANKGGTNQTGVVTATYTDVTFGTEAVDALGEFGGTSFTAVWPGDYQISGRVGWQGMGTSDVPLFIHVVKNATAVYEMAITNSTTSGGIGPMVSGTIELAAGDTLKIQARQDSGSNQTISGSADQTWLSIRRN